MAEKKIKTVSFVHIGDKLVSTDELNAEQKSQVATWLKTTYQSTSDCGIIFYRLLLSGPPY